MALSFASPEALRFHLVSLATAAVAGAATYGTLAVMLPASAMFLGWIAFGLGSPALRAGASNLVAFQLGLLFGIGTAIAIKALTPGLGAGATPVAVAGVVILVLSLRGRAPFNNPLAYFLGLSSFFYSGFAASGTSFAILASAGLIGAASAAVAGMLESVVQRPAAPLRLTAME